MTVPLDIIAASDLASYLQVDVDTIPAVYVTQANGLVTEAWKYPTADGSIPYWVYGIALEVAARPCRNPKGLSSVTKAVDDGSRTERYPDDVQRAGVYLTPTERARLAGTSRRRQRFGTIRTRVGY